MFKHLALGIAVTGLALLGAIACGGDDNKEVALGDLKAADHGTRDATGASTLELELGDNYFEPTFIRGSAGQKLTLTLTNESDGIHNFSVRSQSIDQDVQANEEKTVEVTFPQSGVLLFLCKYHSSAGMNGELLVGDAEPGAAPGASGNRP